jgi:predicted RNA-binding Zn-ribbon protein involved in translation (DUF1610 family)
MFGWLKQKRKRQKRKRLEEAFWQRVPISFRKLLKDFAHQACHSSASGTFTTTDIGDIIVAIRFELSTTYPGLTSEDVDSYSREYLSVRCPNCGEVTEDTVDLYLIAGSGLTAEYRIIVLGPNTDSAGRGRCPGCGSATINVAFTAEKIKSRIGTSNI